MELSESSNIVRCELFDVATDYLSIRDGVGFDRLTHGLALEFVKVMVESIGARGH
jgi:hypothetical protein